MDKNLKKIVKALESQGFTVVPTHKGTRYQVTRNGEYVATFSHRPGDWRGWRNSLQKAKRMGFRWPP